MKRPLGPLRRKARREARGNGKKATAVVLGGLGLPLGAVTGFVIGLVTEAISPGGASDALVGLLLGGGLGAVLPAGAVGYTMTGTSVGRENFPTIQRIDAHVKRARAVTTSRLLKGDPHAQAAYQALLVQRDEAVTLAGEIHEDAQAGVDTPENLRRRRENLEAISREVEELVHALTDLAQERIQGEDREELFRTVTRELKEVSEATTRARNETREGRLR